MNRRGNTELAETIMFIVLNLVFFSALLLFAVRSTGNAIVYEQAYAKQISLMIDEARNDTVYWIDMKKGMDFAKSSGYSGQYVSFGKENDVSLRLTGKEKSGYSYRYFTDYSVEIIHQPNFDNPYLEIKVKK